MVAPFQPNPLRSGVMTLPRRKPTPVERAMANRLSIREQFENRRPMGEVLAEGADVMEGIGVGAIAGIGGFVPDVLALVGRDAPILFSKYALGIPLSEDENALFRALSKVQDVAGAEAIMRGMGYGERIDAPSDSDDALSRAGINPFRQGAFAGEFLADPFAAFKLAKLAKPVFGGSRSTDALADAAAGDAAARAGDLELPEIFRRQTVDDLASDARYVAGPRNMDYAGLSDDELLDEFNRAVDTYNQRRTGGTTDEEFAVTEFDRVQMDIQNEIAGRRGNEHRRLTEDEVAEERARQDEDLPPALTALVNDFLDDVEITDIPPEVVFRVGRGEVEDEIPALFSEGFQSQPGGIGSLDSGNPVFAQNAVKIGGDDQYAGKVRHYSPALTSFVNMVDSGKFARAANKNGEITGTQFLSMLKGDAGVMSEVKDSPFETALLKDPNQKFTAEEIRRLMTTRLPQTRTRLYFNKTVSDAENAGQAPFALSSQTRSYGSSQMPDELRAYNNVKAEGAGGNQPDPDSRVGYFTMIMSNTTGNRIDVPGYGIMKAQDIEGHDYYNRYPGFYGHARGIGVKEFGTNDLYGYVNELQSNAVSNAASGSRILVRNRLGPGGVDSQYFRTLDQRLDAWRQGYERGAEQSVRIPFTPEVSKIMQDRLDLRPQVMSEVDNLQERLDTLEKGVEGRRSGSFETFAPFRVERSADGTTFMNPETRGAAVFAQATPQIDNARSSVRRQYLKLFFPERVSGGYLNVRETGEPYFPSLDNIGATGAIRDFLDSAGQPVSPEVVENVAKNIRDVRFYMNKIYAPEGTASAGDSVSIKHPGVIERFPNILNPAPTSSRLVVRTINKQAFRQLPEAQQVEILSLDESARSADQFFKNQTQALLFEDPVFLEKIKELTSNERDLFEDISQRQVVVDKLVDSFSAEDLKRFTERLTTARAEAEKTFGTLSTDSFVAQFLNDFTDKSQLKSFLGSSAFVPQESLENVLKYADHLEDERKISELTKIIAEKTSSPDYASSIRKFEDALDNHPNGEAMRTLDEVAKATVRSDGKQGFISPLPYDTEADFYSGGLRLLAKELQAKGFKGMIVPDWRVQANQRGFRGQPGTEDKFAKFKKLYGNAFNKSLKEFEKEGGTVEIRNTQPGNEFYIEDADGNKGPIKLVPRAREYDPNLGDVVEVDVPLRIVRFDTPEGKELLSGPIRRAKGGPVDLRPKKRVHSGIGGMARQVM